MKPPRTEAGTNSPALVDLEPQLVALAAERTRESVMRELSASTGFHDKIHIVLLDLAPSDQPVGIISEIFSDRFSYRMAIPARMQPARLNKALVQVALLELANRGARRCAELPSWLVEGLSRQILSSVAAPYSLNKKPSTRELVGYDRLRGSREFLQTNAPLSIQELSFNDLSKMSADQIELYESCSHLLVHSLLRLRGGPQLMGRFVQALPGTLNWQTAFFEVYHALFKGPLDLEKWWMLSWFEIKSRETRETWSPAMSLQRLDALLLAFLEVSRQTNDIPQRRELTLQQVIASSEFPLQKQVIEQKLGQLFFLAPNLAPELAPLAGAYQEVLGSYLRKRSLGEYQPGLRTEPEQRLQHLVKSTIQSLDQLDQARARLRAGQKPNLAVRQ